MPKRYFTNVFSDNQEIGLNASYDFWNDRVYKLIEFVSKNISLVSGNDLYTGTVGVAYMFYRLAISEKFKNDSKRFLNKAIIVLKLKENNFSQKSLCQFICGDAGVSAVNAAIYHQSGDDKMAELYLDHFKSGLSVCKPLDFFKLGGDELFVGRTGYLFGVLWLEKVFGRRIIEDQDVIELCLTIVESGRKRSQKKKSIFPLMYSYYSTEYLGKLYSNTFANL